MQSVDEEFRAKTIQEFQMHSAPAAKRALSLGYHHRSWTCRQPDRLFLQRQPFSGRAHKYREVSIRQSRSSCAEKKGGGGGKEDMASRQCYKNQINRSFA